jgi:hypothetical protein
VGVLKVLEMKGYELEKEVKNSFEDYFNRSEIIYEYEGKEKKLSVLYLRYFEENISQFTPFQSNPVFQHQEHSYDLKDIVAFLYLIKKQDLNDKRVYINDENEFSAISKDLPIEKIHEWLISFSEGHLVLNDVIKR